MLHLGRLIFGACLAGLWNDTSGANYSSSTQLKLCIQKFCTRNINIIQFLWFLSPWFTWFFIDKTNKNRTLCGFSPYLLGFFKHTKVQSKVWTFFFTFLVKKSKRKKCDGKNYNKYGDRAGAGRRASLIAMHCHHCVISLSLPFAFAILKKT